MPGEKWQNEIRPLSRRQLLKEALALGAASLLGYCGRSRFRGPVRHVVLITLDTTRRDHLGFYGNPWIRTPFLDSFAREAIVFNDHLTPVTTTLAAHSSIFTGRYPHNHGVPRNGFILNKANVTLTKVLKSAGFRTAAFIGSFALDKRFGLGEGFDVYDQDFSAFTGSSRIKRNERRCRAVTRSIAAFLKSEGVPPNLFLFAHYFDPHKPYDPQPPEFGLYQDESESNFSEPLRPVTRGSAAAATRVPDIRRRYAEEITGMDASLGQLFDLLKVNKILDEAIVVVASDHGEHLWDAPGGKPFDHGWTVYEPETRALCLVRLPGGQGRTRVTAPTSHIDLFPTLLNYLNLPIPRAVDGVVLDLLGLPTPADSRILFCEATKPYKGVETDRRWYNLLKPRAARRNGQKFIQSLYQGTEELYDLNFDPGEKNNLLIHPRPGDISTANELRSALTAWATGARPLPTHFESTRNQETIKRLKTLGYL